jgi:hypothetical protein
VRETKRFAVAALLVLTGDIALVSSEFSFAGGAFEVVRFLSFLPSAQRMLTVDSRRSPAYHPFNLS